MSKVANQECPGAHEWAALVSGTASLETRSHLTAHLANCDDCAALWRYLTAFTEEAADVLEVREPTPELGEVPVGTSSRWAHLAGRVAATIVGVALLAFALSGGVPRVGVGGGERWRGPTPVLSVSVSWESTSPTPTLRWSTWPGATAYRVRIWDQLGGQLVNRTLDGGSSSFGVEVKDAVVGVVVLWQVDALKGGAVVARSGIERLEWETR